MFSTYDAALDEQAMLSKDNRLVFHAKTPDYPH